MFEVELDPRVKVLNVEGMKNIPGIRFPASVLSFPSETMGRQVREEEKDHPQGLPK